MHGDFSPEHVSVFSDWAKSQKDRYIVKLNKEFDDQASMLITYAPPGTKWTMAQLVEKSRWSVMTTYYLAMATTGF